MIDIGMVGTEQLYWTVGARELDGGLMCTASHNPAGLHGREAREARRARALGRLRHRRAARDRHRGRAGPARPNSRGEITTEDVGDAFRKDALGFIDPTPITPLKVVLDGGNGMAGPMVGPLLDGFPIEQVRTYWEPDGEFPDHEPNPLLEENRRFIIDKVRETGADLGIAWDGDADRCFFIDDTGRFVAGDFLTALLADSILRKEPGAAILYDVRASRAVPRHRRGGRRHAPSSTGWATRSSRRACASWARRSAARCRATTTSTTSTAPTPARSPRS